MDASNGWNGHDPTLTAGSQDDFLSFDMNMNGMTDAMNFDFQDFANHHNGQTMHQNAGDAMETEMNADMGMMPGKDAMMQGQMPPMTSASDMSILSSAPMGFGAPSSGVLEDLDQRIHLLQQQRQYQQQKQLEEAQRRQQFFEQGRMVPPTPNSMEMHSVNNQFYPQADAQQQAYIERYQLRLKEQEMAFTPLVSPAVTPLESHFNLDQYTVPGAYFSPLSSPALHAQNEHRSAYETHLNGSSSVTSPIDMNIDLNAGPTRPGANSKKSKKAPIKTKPRSVRQSPIVKPQRRKAPGSTTISPQTLANIIEPGLKSQVATKTQASLSAASGTSTTEGSENDSVSPEQLSDMAPPPLPRSARSSPFIASQNGQTRVQQLSAGMSPATPASLMRLSKGSAQTSPAIESHETSLLEDHIMDEFALPEPANPARPSLARLDTQSSGQTTPTVDSARTPGLAPLPSPAFAKPPSAKSSPRILAQIGGQDHSNSSTSTPSIRKTPLLAVRGSSISGPSSAGPTAKKRASISSNSTLVSPALRPRISPSIKPLIRGSANGGLASNNQHISDDTASLLLASKSNYQNILEGTHLPGVSYPTELSTNLTSKRTSHKIAEQGRRNRINSALAEIATLLPKKDKEETSKSESADGEEDSKADAAVKDKEKKEDRDKGGQSASSKASTVECAIEYIKQLKLDLEAATKRAEEAEKKLSEVGDA